MNVRHNSDSVSRMPSMCARVLSTAYAHYSEYNYGQWSTSAIIDFFA